MNDPLHPRCPQCGDYGHRITSLRSTHEEYLCLNLACPQKEYTGEARSTGFFEIEAGEGLGAGMLVCIQEGKLYATCTKDEIRTSLVDRIVGTVRWPIAQGTMCKVGRGDDADVLRFGIYDRMRGFR